MAILEAEKGKWVTIRGNAVQISDDGTVLSGPLKGKKLGKGGGKGGEEKPDGRDIGISALRKYPGKPESYRESRHIRESLSTLDAIRNAGEADLEKRLEKLDRRHRALLRAEIERAGRVQDVPQSVWDQIQRDIEEETTAAIMLLILAADEWTTDEIAGLDVSTTGRTKRQDATYSLAAVRHTMGTAGATTETLRDRLARKIEDAKATGPGAVGTLTGEGIEAALDDVMTDARRKGIATDMTTSSLSVGQRGAKQRTAGDDGATEDGGGQKVTIGLRWNTEQDDRTCSRCSPLEGTTEEIWGNVFPDGPGPDAHPNCRCWLSPVAIVTARESFRESEKWVTIRGNAVKIDDDGTVLSGALKGKKLGKPKAGKAKAGKPKTAEPKEKPATKAKTSAKKPSNARTFASDKEADEWGEKHYSGVKLDKTQHDYLDWYQNEGYKDINGVLRSGKDAKSAKVLDKILALSPATPEEIVVHRGLATKLRGVKIGGVIKDRGYMSTSLDASVSDAFNQGGGDLLKIRVPKGSRGIYMDAVMDAGEQEFLMPRGTKLKIVGVESRGKGRAIMAEVIHDAA